MLAIQMLAISTIKRKLTSALINRMEKAYQPAKRKGYGREDKISIKIIKLENIFFHLQQEEEEIIVLTGK